MRLLSTRASLASCAAVLALETLAVSAQPPVQRRPVSLVVTGGTVVTMDASRAILSPGALAIDDDTIVEVGTPDVIAARFAARATIEAVGQVVMPGLVNTHTHAPMVLYRGLADDLALMDWLERYIFPAESKTVSPEFVAAGTRLAALEMIESGTTTFADMYYFEEEIARAASGAGLRSVPGQTIIRFPVADAPSPRDSLARAERMIRAWKDHPLVTPAVAPHSLYTLDATDLRAARDLARAHDVPLLIHLAETRGEVDVVRAEHGLSPTAYLASLEMLSPRTLAAHAVWVDQDDLALMQEHGVGLSHNPESNMKLASGTAPVTDYLAANLPLGLGTDGAASNNDLDMFEAARIAALLHKLQSNDPKVVSAPVALEMATLGGARALGLDGLIGSLEAGKKADLIIVAMDAARQTPLYDPVSHLVYVVRGDDVRTTIVNGRVLMQDRQVLSLDAGRVLAEANRFAEQVRAAVR